MHESKIHFPERVRLVEQEDVVKRAPDRLLHVAARFADILGEHACLDIVEFQLIGVVFDGLPRECLARFFQHRLTRFPRLPRSVRF